LATTDMAVAAMIPAALYALTLLLEQPSWPRTIAFGVILAAGLLSEYSFIIYFPIAALVLFIVRPRFPIKPLPRAIAIAFLLLWATFRFTISTLQAADARATDMCAEVFHAPRVATALPLPAPDYIIGGIEVARHDHRGHRALLFGKMKDPGWWWYY